MAWELGSVHAVSLSALTALGSFDELARRYTLAVDAAQQRGNIASFVTLVATNRCVIDLVADRPAQCFVRGMAALAADGCEPAARARIVRRCAARLLAGRPRDVRASGHLLRAQLATWQDRPEQALKDYAQAAELWEGVGIYLGWIARQRMGELMGGDVGAAWIAQAQAWARSQRIVKVDRFFAACGPISRAAAGPTPSADPTGNRPADHA